MSKMSILLLFILFLYAIALPAEAARGGGDRGGDGRDRGQGQGISSGDAAEIARRQTGGRVLAVKPGSGGYQVKVLTPNGEVRYVFVPDAGR